MSPHPRTLLLLPSFITRSSTGTPAHQARLYHLQPLGVCRADPTAKLHFLISHLGAGVRWLYSHFHVMAFSHMHHMLAA